MPRRPNPYIKEIIKDYKNGKNTRELSIKYGLSVSQLYLIIRSYNPDLSRDNITEKGITQVYNIIKDQNNDNNNSEISMARKTSSHLTTISEEEKELMQRLIIKACANRSVSQEETLKALKILKRL